MNKNIQKTMKSIEKLRLPELQARYAELTGTATRSPNRTFLLRRIEETLETRANRGATEASKKAPKGRGRRRAEEAAPTGEPMSDVDTVATLIAEPTSEVTIDVTPALTAEPTPDVAIDVEPTPTTEAEPEVAIPAPATDETKRPRGRFATMSIEDLQAKYLEVVGRATGSDDRRYLSVKISEAERGLVPVGPRSAHAGEPADVKVLPLRLESAVVDRMDEAWRTRGIKSRMEFLRRALGHYLTHIGAEDAASMFATGTDVAG